MVCELTINAGEKSLGGVLVLERKDNSNELNGHLIVAQKC
jgi:hypothetical protein